MGSKKKGRDRRGIVYSTDPDFEYQDDRDQEETLEPSEQKLVVRIDRRQRKGKEVTLVEGFVGSDEDLADLGRDLRKACGAGGSAKDGFILVQGDVRDKVVTWLEKAGYGARRGN
jgi:translation initiation factor 1